MVGEGGGVGGRGGLGGRGVDQVPTFDVKSNEAPPVGGSKWFAHLPIPHKL